MTRFFEIKLRQDLVLHRDQVAHRDQEALKAQIVVYQVQKQQIECQNLNQRGMIDFLQNNFY